MRRRQPIDAAPAIAPKRRESPSPARFVTRAGRRYRRGRRHDSTLTRTTPTSRTPGSRTMRVSSPRASVGEDPERHLDHRQEFGRGPDEIVGLARGNDLLRAGLDRRSLRCAGGEVARPVGELGCDLGEQHPGVRRAATRGPGPIGEQRRRRPQAPRGAPAGTARRRRSRRSLRPGSGWPASPARRHYGAAVLRMAPELRWNWRLDAAIVSRPLSRHRDPP